MNDITDVEKELTPEEAELIAQQEAVLDKLVEYVGSEFSTRRSLRTTIESRWLTAESLYLGSLGASVNDTKNPFKHDDREDYKPGFNLVRTKVDNTVSAIVSSQFATGDKNWNLKPSPYIIANPEDTQKAIEAASQKAEMVTQEMVQSELQRISQEKARGMSNVIEDQLNQCAYGENCREAIHDYVKYGTGILKGPTNSERMRKTYTMAVSSQGQKVFIPELSYEPRPGVFRVDPWLFFPDMSTADPACIPNSIEVHPKTSRQLQDLKHNEGFDAEKIDKVLETPPKSWEAPATSFGPAGLTSGTERIFKDKYLLLEYHGPVSTQKLQLLDIPYSCENEDEETVWCEIWVCNGQLLRLAVHPLEGQNEIPYALDNYKDDPGSVFGFGLCDILQDQQRTVNDLFGYAKWNVGLSAMPISIINKAIISPARIGQGLDLEPGKVYVANEHDSDVDLSRAITFIDIPTNQQEIIAFMDFVRGLAEEESNMPATMAGMQTPQGEETATGVAVRGENVTAPLFFQSQQWDDHITKKVIGWMYDWNMQYNPDDSVKGAFDVDVVTHTQRIKQQKMRLDVQNVLQMAGQNPEVDLNVDTNQLLRDLLAMMSIPEGAIRSLEAAEAERQRRAENQQPDPNMLKAQADMMMAENKSKELELESQRLQMEGQEFQHRAQMEYASKLENYETREMEAQVRLEEKRMDMMIEWIKLAQKDEENRAKYVMEAEKIQSKLAFDRTKLGVDTQLKIGDQSQKSREMDIKERHGSGI